MAELKVLNNRSSDSTSQPPAAQLAGSMHVQHSRSDLDPAWIESQLRSLLSGTDSQVRFSQHDRLLYSTDASLYQQEPLGVAVPASTSDAQLVVDLCARLKIPVLPRGGGTSLAGQCTNRAVVIDMTPMCRGIGQVSRGVQIETTHIPVEGRAGSWEGDWVEVEPGCTIDELNEELSRRGHRLFFAPDPATTRQAAIGGCLGNNAAGARSIRYGRTSENVLAIESVLATGERVWFEPNAGKSNPRVRAIAQRVIEIVRAHEQQIRERFPKTVRRNAGLGLDMILAQLDQGATAETINLAPLLCGSEGILALTTRARLKLMPTPSSKGLMVVSFQTLEDAIAAVKPILDLGLPLGLSAVELLDDVVLGAARGNIEYRRYVDLLPGANAERQEPKAVLYIEYFDFSTNSNENGLQHAFRATTELLTGMHGLLPNGVASYTDAQAMLKAWALRKAGEPLLHGLPGDRKPITFVEDNAVPIEHLGEFVRAFKEIVGKHGTRAAYWAHASVGVLHVRPMIDLHDQDDRERMVKIAVEVADLARACNGIMSGEHGDGKVRGPLLERFFGPELIHAFRQVKAAFDPNNIFNPGNIVGPYPGIRSIAQGLRVDAAASQHAHDHSDPDSLDNLDTYYEYTREQGFGHAVEQCNGAGVCRKRSGGTMCPSYMGTQDERHSTRGRGNALRLAMTGQFNLVTNSGSTQGQHSCGKPIFNDPQTQATLNLCLSCKACKSECPSNVDIAKLKAEYTAQGFKALGSPPPLKARVFGNVRVLNRLGSLAPALMNRLNRLRITRVVLTKMLNIDPRRSLPEFSTSLWSLLEQRRRSKPTESDASKKVGDKMPTVVLYADCFTAYNEPRIGLAAVNVLEALGYRVRVLPDRGTLLDGCSGNAGCCGRAMISTGLLQDAIATIDNTLNILKPAIEDPNVAAIVVCEPSCLSAIKDDWLELKLDTPRHIRTRLAEKALLVEDFVDRYWDKHPVKPTIRAEALPTRVLLHGHCHQKALWGVDTSSRLLKRLVGDRLKVLDTGCCGMAGAFGFTTDRYELSMKIAEISLLPQIRSAGPDIAICAPGTSCRHQILDADRVHALHPIELAATLLQGCP